MAAGRSLWLQEALRDEEGGDAPELLEAIEADICVVGGGYTGLWAALRIKEWAGRRTGDLPPELAHEVVHRDDLVVLP